MNVVLKNGEEDIGEWEMGGFPDIPSGTDIQIDGKPFKWWSVDLRFYSDSDFGGPPVVYAVAHVTPWVHEVGG